jgi:hypothetical protein
MLDRFEQLVQHAHNACDGFHHDDARTFALEALAMSGTNGFFVTPSLATQVQNVLRRVAGARSYSLPEWLTHSPLVVEHPSVPSSEGEFSSPAIGRPSDPGWHAVV